MRVAVIGHVEWIDFVRVEHVPEAGEIVHAGDAWSEPGGGGAVAAVQLARLAGEALFLTALGDDDLGRRALAGLSALGVRVAAVLRSEPQRRAITMVDARGERTITVLGDRAAPRGDDDLPWDEVETADAVYVTAADVLALRRARGTRVLVATARILPALASAGVEVDALVGSALDPAERYAEGDLDPAPGVVVRTEGAAGGTFAVRGFPPVRYEPAGPPGPVVDAYGCGDAFAAGLTYALGRGRTAREAVGFAASCGAAVLTGRGPYEAQIRLDGAGATFG